MLGQADPVQDGVEENVVYCVLVGTTLTSWQEHRMVLFTILLCPSWEEAVGLTKDRPGGGHASESGELERGDAQQGCFTKQHL